MNGEVADQSLKEEALKVCKEYIGGQWSKISISEFTFSKLKGGFSNTMYLCSLPEDSDSRGPKKVLLRKYGALLSDPQVLVPEAVTFMLLSERKLGPKLYGLLPNGRLEEYIPSHTLNSDEIRLYAHLIAREFAKIHALNVPQRKVPDLFEKWSAKWLVDVANVLYKDEEKYFMSVSDYKKEVEWVTKEIAKTNSPVVYCHNDLQGGNILFRKDTPPNASPNLLLIDFEFGSYNFRGFDFANHFSEWCFDYATAEYPYFRCNFDKFPSRKEQIDFFTNYLDQLSKEGVIPKKPLNEEIESMLSEITIFCCAANILWSIWGASMVLESRDELAHCEFGKTRKELYLKFKEQYLASCSDTKDNQF